LQRKITKIAIVAYNLDIGGLSKVVYTLYNILESVKSIKIELLLLDQIDDIQGISNYILFKKRHRDKKKLIRKFKTYIDFKKHLKSSNFNFIIDQRYRLNPLSEFLFTKYLYSNSKVIYGVHSSRLKTYFPEQKYLSRFLFNKAYAIVCCSNGVKKLVKDKFKFSNVITIYNSIDLNTDLQIENKFSFSFILSVGRVEPEKQIDKLILSYANTSLPKKGIKLIILGDGSHILKCKELVNQLNLNDKVDFIGFVSNPKEYFNSALFLVLCSKYEGFSMVTLESLASSTPVISFDLEGPNEIIIQNKNGILVKNQDFNSLSSTIDDLASNDTLLKDFAKNAKESILHFSNKKIKEDWLKLLQIKAE